MLFWVLISIRTAVVITLNSLIDWIRTDIVARMLSCCCELANNVKRNATDNCHKTRIVVRTDDNTAAITGVKVLFGLVQNGPIVFASTTVIHLFKHLLGRDLCLKFLLVPQSLLPTSLEHHSYQEKREDDDERADDDDDDAVEDALDGADHA